jgi:hypothetical protein
LPIATQVALEPQPRGYARRATMPNLNLTSAQD